MRALIYISPSVKMLMPHIHEGDYTMRRNNDEYTVVPVIPVDELEHTEGHPFCTDPHCPCKEDQDAIQQTYQQYQDGLLSADDRDRIYRGRMV